MYETYTVTSFSNFIETVESKEKDNLVLFRGQPNDSTLLPKISRLNPLIDTTEIEMKMLKDLSRRSNDFIQSSMKSEWDWLALGQHYGLSTRLLDWTTNPLIALWFACNSKNISDNNSVLWIFAVPDDALLDIEKEATPFNGGKTKVFQPNIVGKRLANQLGWFTAHKYSRRATPHRFVPLELNPDQAGNLIKMLIPKNLRGKFIEVLDTCGVNSATVFPELDGLCRHINWIHLNE